MKKYVKREVKDQVKAPNPRRINDALRITNYSCIIAFPPLLPDALPSASPDALPSALPDAFGNIGRFPFGIWKLGFWIFHPLLPATRSATTSATFLICTGDCHLLKDQFALKQKPRVWRSLAKLGATSSKLTNVSGAYEPPLTSVHSWSYSGVASPTSSTRWPFFNSSGGVLVIGESM